MNLKQFLFFAFLIIFGCVKNMGQASFESVLKELPHIEGKETYLNSPFVTAGDRVYMVGHQNGSFPELGWHIKGEMSGIWDPPIKLLDGFDVDLVWEDASLFLRPRPKFCQLSFCEFARVLYP